MRYEKMLPYQLRNAIKEQVPLAVPIGVLEYHSEHLALGVDAHVVARILERLETEHPEMVLFPTFYLGTASYAVAGPGNNGTVNVDSNAVQILAENLFRALLAIGFRNIHGFCFHQSENFEQGMPTDLAFRAAARRVIFEFLEQQQGQGWWGNEAMSNYYDGNNPFDWIMIHGMADAEIQRRYPEDHAGRMETSLMLALAPEEVDLTHFSAAPWYSRNATTATRQYGEEIVQAYLQRMSSILFPAGT